MKVHIDIDKLTINHPLDIYEIMQLVLKREHKMDRNKEHFWVLALNNANKILNLELVSLGSVSRAIVKPMEVLSIPLQKQAVGVILVHNHPSGKLTPSEADKDLTDLLIQACRLMETPVLDHVIITAHSYLSFKETGLLERLEASNKYVLPYELEKQYYEEMQAAIHEVEKESKRKVRESLKKGEEKGVKKGMQTERRQIARTMLTQLHLGIDVVQQATGLSKRQLEELAREIGRN